MQFKTLKTPPHLLRRLLSHVAWLLIRRLPEVIALAALLTLAGLGLTVSAHAQSVGTALLHSRPDNWVWPVAGAVLGCLAQLFHVSPPSGLGSLDSQRAGKNRLERRVPLVRQTEQVDSAAACLAMVVAWYGREAALTEVHQACGIGRTGPCIAAITMGARRLGFETRLASIAPQTIHALQLPAIVPVMPQPDEPPALPAGETAPRFVVLEHVGATHCELSDPAKGRVRWTRQQLFDHVGPGAVGVSIE